MFIITCEHCGELFEAAWSGRRFCTHHCYAESLITQTERACDHCGKTFNQRDQRNNKSGKRIQNGRFCSRACWRAHNKGAANPAWKGGYETYTCLHCGQDFQKPLAYKRSPRNPCFYCSHTCKVAHWREHPETSGNWRGGLADENDRARKHWRFHEWRKAVYARDDYTCQRCGKRGARIQAHHLYPWRHFPHLRYAVSNGQVLCFECHQAIKWHESDYLVSIGLSPLQPPLFMLEAA